jgi:hypothetical protein
MLHPADSTPPSEQAVQRFQQAPTASAASARTSLSILARWLSISQAARPSVALGRDNERRWHRQCRWCCSRCADCVTAPRSGQHHLVVSEQGACGCAIEQMRSQLHRRAHCSPTHAIADDSRRLRQRCGSFARCSNIFVVFTPKPPLARQCRHALSGGRRHRGWSTCQRSAIRCRRTCKAACCRWHRTTHSSQCCGRVV